MELETRVTIGVFWHYKKIILGKRISPQQGIERVKGLIDSPYDHMNVWQEVRYLRPELSFMDYDEVARGRALYVTARHGLMIYMDRSLFSKKCKESIRRFFGAHENTVLWRADDHYTTEPRNINFLFESDNGIHGGMND